MILVSGHFHHFRVPICWLYRPSKATCFVVFKKIMETGSGSKANEPEAQGLDLHLCIICQRKTNENLVEKPEAHNFTKKFGY